MQMRGAVSVLVRGTVKSLKWRLVFTKDQYSARCSSPLWLKPYHKSSALGSLVIITESLEECVRRLLTWKEAMEKKGPRVNAGKTKIMICGTGLDLMQSSGEFPCAVCRTGVSSNSTFCNGCKHWVHKKCSGLKRLKKDPDYRCTRTTRCQGTARPLDGRPQKEVQVGPDELEVVAFFCYLGDMLSAAGGCELSTTTCVKTAWKMFKDLLPILSSRHLSFKTRGHVNSSCVRSTMLHASETWPLTKPNLQRLQRNDRAMIRLICNVRPQDIVTTRSNELLVRLGFEDLDLILKERRLCMDMWNAPMVQSRQPLTYRLMESMGLGGPKWHGNSWQRGIVESGSFRLSTLMIDVPGDLVWDLPCMQQASYLEGGPQMWMLPLYLHVNQKSDYDYDDDDIVWWKSIDIITQQLLSRNENTNLLRTDNCQIDEICPSAISNQVSTISMHTPSLVKIHWHLVKLSSGNENMYVWRADKSVKTWRNFLINNPKPDFHNINAHTHRVWWKSIDIYSSYHPETKIQTFLREVHYEVIPLIFLCL